MRKIVSILVLLLYLGLSTVEVIQIHFCHGELEAVRLSAQTESCCEGMHNDHSSCCDDIVIDVDFENEHIFSAESEIKPNLLMTEVIREFDQLSDSDIRYDHVPLSVRRFSLPPPEPVYLTTHSLLFYG